MKRRGSPILKSLKVQIKNSKTEDHLRSNDNSTVSYNDEKEFGFIDYYSSSTSTTASIDYHSSSTSTTTSRAVSQKSNFTTQGTQSFRTRLEKKFLDVRISGTSPPGVQQNKLEISLDPCSPLNVDIGPFFGLPSKVQDLIFQTKRIKGLYDWQKECIQSGLSGNNLLISLPTSSGKTLVAEILMLRKLLLHQKDALFILPYISLVQEKVRGLCSLAVELNFVVDEYAASKGYYPPKKRRRRNTIYVATLEKGNSLIESFLETDRIGEIGVVVVDEIHMLTETGGRGGKLETTITKLKHFAKNIQLISMSATVGNLDELAFFLGATLFQGGFRPVPLTQYLKVENEIVIFNPDALTDEELFQPCNKTLSIQPNGKSKLDQDMLTPLVAEIIPEHSCLVFCHSRSNTEAVAKLLCYCLPKSLLEWRKSQKGSLMMALQEEGSGSLCPVLYKTVPFGIAYHHSGLTEGERKLIEEAYIMGTLCCIVCTSTLAAGVNLPARRVLIRAPYVGKDFLTRSRYHQMIGRAGRAGLDSVGESFMIVPSKDVEKVKELLLSPVEKCFSRLLDNDSKGLTDLLFSMIGLQLVKSISSAFRLVEDSLLAIQTKTLGVDLRSEVLNVLEKLRSQGLLRCKEPTGVGLRRSPRASKNKKVATPDKPLATSKLHKDAELVICRVGKAAIKGSIELRWANRLYFDLVNARANLAVHSHLHLLFLVIPYDSSDTFPCHPQTFFHVYDKLNDEEREIAALLGITNARAVKISLGMQPKQLDHLVLQRFCMALLLHRLLSGDSIWKVSSVFNVERGRIQQIFNATVSFAHSVLYFCEELEELWAFKDLLSSFTKTLSICSYSEITPLLSLPAVKFGRAKLLYKAGFKGLADIAKASPQQLAKKVEHLSPNIAGQIISSAKMLLLEKANDLQEEAEDMLLSLK